ncbi:conserved hypothetical protein [Methylocella silvestris BL2]|uniref:DUF3597 domain-containing protein n=1 Tax=Methylocella silvestris (strain DSM 15510 / CIP 108128 / LMG 27833 / NCIMB 13906 / BL2) TaxID=395965 RepID=B8EM07_METSB|nr:DUF3597 domain-containing protein [Methylocella silvestris]ACK50788.1 conserved hypothetical protein [Methylocella silvestris BL2]
MSIFGNIVSKLFGHSKAEAAPVTPPAGGAPAAHAPAPASAGSTTTAAAPAAGGAAPAPTALKDVDVASILDGLVAKQGQKLDWRHSIVDLLKTLDLDSSLTARKELASELHYSGSTDDTATMNVWLIKQVLAKLAENGGKLPADLVH